VYSMRDSQGLSRRFVEKIREDVSMRGPACISEGNLRAFALGELPERISVLVSQHLEGCPECEAAASQLDELTDLVICSLRRVLCPAAVDSAAQ
jgi:anti-sigma factor RsiW